MTQSVILENLAKYLELTSPDTTKETRELLRKVGHCFGFSLCYSTLHKTGKLAEWKDDLVRVASWDGTQKKLDKMKAALEEKAGVEEKVEPKENSSTVKASVSLPTQKSRFLIPPPPGFISPVVTDKVTEKKKVRKLDSFEKVLNFVVFQHSYGYTNFMLRDQSHSTILSPEYEVNDPKTSAVKRTSIFELLDADNKVLHAQDRKIVVRNFDMRGLALILARNKTNIEKSIFLIHNQDHTITLIRENGKWILSNPNYDHTSKDTMDKVFDTEEAVAKEILAIQGSSLALEWASLDQPLAIVIPPLPMYVSQLSNFGLFMRVQYDKDFDSRQLNDVLFLADRSADSVKVIAEAISATTYDGWSTLHAVAIFRPEFLNRIYQTVIKSPHAQIHLAKALTVINSNGIPAWQTVKNVAPGLLNEMLRVVGYDSLCTIAISNGDCELLKYIAEKGHKIKNNISEIFHDANSFAYVENAQTVNDVQKVKLKKIRNTLQVLATNNPAAVNVVDSDGDFPLSWAFHTNDYESAKILIDNDADIKLLDSKGLNALAVGIAKHGDKLDPRLVKLFKTKQLEAAVKEIAIDKVIDLLREGADATKISLKDIFYNANTNKLHVENAYKQRNPQVIAKSSFIKKIIMVLVENGFSVNQADLDGNTMLHIALLMNDYHLAAKLIALGADATKVNGPGITPLAAGIEQHGVNLDSALKQLLLNSQFCLNAVNPIPKVYAEHIKTNALSTCKEILEAYVKKGHKNRMFYTMSPNTITIQNAIKQWENFSSIQDVYNALLKYNILHLEDRLIERLNVCARLNNEELVLQRYSMPKVVLNHQYHH